ncbi:response regulator [Propioniferax innocua]|uniref:LuxR family two component transcriptional regulator n=1 Tax=Propioniferax innocua TaxID=1753 RepID=A0A542ZPT3_9ACTN|nr:response regulator transcription factor [Propioniferax innocua]TQL62337.1 LuxR family two component transcriptional regulator [Propioniferax innocua]
MIRVAIADDHPLVRDGIAAILTRDEEIEVVLEASSGPELVTLLPRHSPDVVLCDLRMPGGDGVEAIRAIRSGSAGPEHVTVKILVLTTYDTDHDIRSALAAGADGYLLKDAPRAELIRAVHDLAAGRPVLSPAALRALSSPDAAAERLTPREIAVVNELARGGTNRTAAARMHVSETTFKTHLAHIYTKLGVSDRAAAVRVAYEKGWI